MASITVAELLIEIGVDASDAQKAQAKLEKQLGKTGKAAKGLADDVDDADESLAKMGETAGRLAGGLTKLLKRTAAVTAGLGAAVIKTGSDFETLSARLKTVTGSSEAAERALSFVKDFATNTPFQVGEITDAFVKLQNLGIRPTEERLTAFGNIAAGNSKSLDQFTEAVLDASSGEFERLKEFGIRARQNGDQVALTFRGVTETIGNNAADITEFLTEIGLNDFSGAMAERMNTLEGVISNAKDQFTNFLLEVAQDGPLQEFKGLINDIREGAGGPNGLAKTLSRTLVSAIRAVRRIVSGDFIKVLEAGAKALQLVVDNWEILVGLIAGAKTVQAFAVAAGGLSSLGIAASSALGPIGLIAGALIALIPIANKAGNAIGNAIAKRSQLLEGPKAKRGAPSRLGRFTGEEQSQLKLKDTQIAALNKKAADLQGRGVSLRSPAGKRILDDRDALVAERASLQAGFSARAQTREAEEAAKAAAAEEQRRRDEAELAAEEAEFQALGPDAFGPEFIPEAFKTPSRGRGGGSKRKRITSPTSVSEFFRAAAAGDLGPIAARTPSTKEIEPTVAVDITNNTFNFDIKQDIKGQGSPTETAARVAEAVRAEFQGRLASAGQQLASNLVR